MPPKKKNANANIGPEEVRIRYKDIVDPVSKKPVVSIVSRRVASSLVPQRAEYVKD